MLHCFPRLIKSATAFPSITAPPLLCSVVQSFYYTVCLRLTGSSQVRSPVTYEYRETFHCTVADNGEILQRLLTERYVRISEHLLVLCPIYAPFVLFDLHASVHCRRNLCSGNILSLILFYS